tara:strand:- start:5 stop:772 length:768 start_codon:yes stop_codon:yes gene_type:complete
MKTDYFQAFLLAIVQGISEFIPVSSSAHLIILSKISNFSISSLQLDISLHSGSLLAIIFYFRKDLLNIINNKSLFLLIVLGSIPLILVGYFFYTSGLIENLRNLKIIAWTTLIFGILLFIADRTKVKNKINNNLNFKNILIIGIIQILAIIPGASRSGVIITASRFLNFDRVDSSKISFYLSIPALLGASVLSFKDIYNTNIDLNFIFLFAVMFSFVFSYLTIKYFLVYVKNFNLNLFVYYRTILALILFIIAYS